MNKQEPLVTVGIRTYKRPKSLKRAIKSVLNQTYTNLQIIIFDDHSPDNTADVVNKFAKKDKRIEYHRMKRNVGHGKGLNVIIDNAKGKYLTFLDDDDAWRPDKIQKQVTKFESCDQSVGLITGGIHYWLVDDIDELTNKKTKEIWIPKRKGNVFKRSLNSSGHIFGPPSIVMISKEAIKKTGRFQEDMPRGSCQEYFRRVAKNYNIDFVKDLILDYYYHNKAITHYTTKEDLKKTIKSLDVKLSNAFYNDFPRIKSQIVLQKAYYYLEMGDDKSAFTCINEAHKIKPKLITFISKNAFFIIKKKPIILKIFDRINF